MHMSHQQQGVRGETIACQYLRVHGYTIIERNIRFRRGEIDIIAQYNAYNINELVFFEVKTRSTEYFSRIEESVTFAKQLKFRSAVRLYLAKHPTHAMPRIDVIFVKLDIYHKKAHIQHIINAFS